MKQALLIIVSLCFAMLLHAQVSKSISITAGGLSFALTATELNTITKLTLTGTTDARDFKNGKVIDLTDGMTNAGA